MALNHALICGACERECPSWADRCPACGSPALVRRIVIDPADRIAPGVASAEPMATNSTATTPPIAAMVGTKPPRSKPTRSRRADGHPPRRQGTPAHSTA